MASLGSLLSEPDLRRMLEEVGDSLPHRELQLILDHLTSRGLLRKRQREYRIHAHGTCHWNDLMRIVNT